MEKSISICSKDFNALLSTVLSLRPVIRAFAAALCVKTSTVESNCHKCRAASAASRMNQALKFYAFPYKPVTKFPVDVTCLKSRHVFQDVRHFHFGLTSNRCGSKQ